METKQVKQAVPATTERTEKKTAYTPPQVEIIKMEVEGVIAGSSILSDFEPGGTWGPPKSTVSTRRGYNSASGSELEDLINDILTVEQ